MRLADRPIGIFDSGLGGLTIVKATKRLLPKERLLYLGDTARLPYGEKSEEIIKQYTYESVEFLLKRGVKVVVIACHSSSSVALDELKKKLRVPVIGVIEPGAKAAVAVTKNQKIGVIGTRATIKAGAYERKLKELKKELEIIARPAPLLVPLVEEGWIDNNITKQVLKFYLKPFKEEKIDTLLLGCTHYPLLKKLMREVYGEKLKIVDSSNETAKAIKEILEKNNALRRNGQGDLKIYLSDFTPEFERTARAFLGFLPDKIMRTTLSA